MENVKKFRSMPKLDKKIIEGIPWAEEMWKILENGLSKAFLHWCQLVLNMGEKEDVVGGWVKTFIDAHEETCCELVFDMENLQGRVVEKVERLLQKMQQLCHTLQIGLPIVPKQLSLCQAQNQLKGHIDEYEKLIEIRQKELNQLREKQLELCNSLGKESKILKNNPLPSAEEVDEFRRHIEKLENNLQKSLNKQLKSVKEDIAHLRTKVDDYWNLLDIALKEREEFRQRHKGNSVDVLEALKAETKRCEELKKANIKVFIDKLRTELCQMWEKCHCSQTTRREFSFYYSDCYNEDLLELHEVELKKWKKYYEENKRKRHWTEPVQQPGGQLLKEEKERNKLSKLIPQIEDTLEDLANKYQLRYNVSFTTYGQSVQEYISNLHEDRENAKKQKLSARKLQREKSVLTPAKSVMNLFPSTSCMTPHSTTKRKLATPLTEEKKPRVALKEVRTNKIR
ncbi:hypothetical protein NQ318_001033, partial [Aromia moschata]